MYIGPPDVILPDYTESIEVKDGSDSKATDPSNEGESKKKPTCTDNEEGAGAIVEEEKDSGTVKIHIYKLYISAVGVTLSLSILISLIAMQVNCTLVNYLTSSISSVDKFLFIQLNYGQKSSIHQTSSYKN